jgi:hypothetical protein
MGRIHWLALGGVVLAGGVVVPAVSLAGTAPAAPDPSQTLFFESRIRPLLIDRCAKCHGPTQPQGGLRLDSREALLKGGTRGPAVLPGQPDGSLLLQAVLHRAPAPRMPPSGRLSAVEVADLERWVRLGVPWGASSPAGTGTAIATEQHWAFRPVGRPQVPAVKTRGWVRTPIDAFILSRLEREGLKPAPAADRRTLIRRATYDLTGLPPTPEEIAAFVQDRSPAPDAWRKAVDRLLDSPHYGEKWGRHWLDVARYADSNGLDENVHLGNAWRYRDYVVQALNEDKPFDRFLLEQVAGDLLPDGDDLKARNQRLTATGFLCIGPKVISEPDDRKLEMDMIDEQIDTLGKVTMAVTLGCARCHDHKFDPISTEDYYALAGIFKSTITMVAQKKPRMWFEHSLASPEQKEAEQAHLARVGAHKKAIEAKLAAATEALRQSLAPNATLPKNPEPSFPAETKAELARLRAELTELEKNAPSMPLAMGVSDGAPTDVAVHLRGSYQTLGKKVARRFPVVLASAGAESLDQRHSGRMELARWLISPEHPLTARVAVNRVWRWHFGRGIVASTDNFGRLGEKPSHPELLDWLARNFTAPAGGPENGCGWSLKRLHRLLMLSGTYQMSSSQSAEATAKDPENLLFGRASMRRLEAEELRDSLLSVAGNLDRTFGGTLLTLKNREYFFDHTSKDRTSYDSRRRSLYLPVVRNHLYDVFQLFDFGDGAVPDGNRATTTVAPQALFMLNSDLADAASKGLARQLLGRSELGTDDRLRLLYPMIYGRPPAEPEVARMRGLLGRLEERAAGDATTRAQHAWSWLCHTTLAANEFVYLR